MTFDELQRWLAGHGGFRERIPRTIRETVKTPAGDQTSDTTVYDMVAQDGSRVTVKVSGGSNDPTGNTYEVVGEPHLTTPQSQDRKSTCLNSSHVSESRMPSSA